MGKRFLVFLTVCCFGLMLMGCGCDVENPQVLNSCGYVPVTNATVVKLQNQVKVLTLEVEGLKTEVKDLKKKLKKISEAVKQAQDAAIKAKEAAIEAEISAEKCEKAFEKSLVK